MSQTKNQTAQTPFDENLTARTGDSRRTRVAMIFIGVLVVIVGGIAGWTGVFTGTDAPARTHVTTSQAPLPGAPVTPNADGTVTLPAGTDVSADTAVEVAEAYLTQTVTDLSVLNAKSAADTLPAISAYLTDDVAATVEAGADAESIYNDVVPFNAQGVEVLKAEVTSKAAAEVYGTSGTTQDVNYTVTARWTMANGETWNVTRTGQMRLVPGADADGMAFQIAGAKGHTDIK